MLNRITPLSVFVVQVLFVIHGWRKRQAWTPMLAPFGRGIGTSRPCSALRQAFGMPARESAVRARPRSACCPCAVHAARRRHGWLRANVDPVSGS